MPFATIVKNKTYTYSYTRLIVPVPDAILLQVEQAALASKRTLSQEINWIVACWAENNKSQDELAQLIRRTK